MKKLVIIMLVLLTMTQNSTAQTAGGETKIFPMFGLTLSKMNNDIILTDAGRITAVLAAGYWKLSLISKRVCSLLLVYFAEISFLFNFI